MVIKMIKKNYELIISIIIYVLLGIIAIMCLYPLLWLLLNSFKTNSELFGNPWGLPKAFTIENYTKAWTVGNVGVYFFNSSMVTVISSSISILLSVTAAYAISRMKWKLSGVVLLVFLIGVMVPNHSTLIPLFSMFQSAKILNSYTALILPYVAFGLPIAIFLLTGYFESIPRELEEAALIDGCKLPQILFRIIIPISKPTIVTVLVSNFITMWNDLLFALVFMTDTKKMTLPVGLTQFVGRYGVDYTGMIAAIIFTVVPSILVYVFLHDKIIAGMTSGAVKG